MQMQSETTEVGQVASLRSGDAAVWQQLVAEKTGRLLQVARRITGSEAEAEDAVQDAFLLAYRGFSGFDGRASLSTWLHRITVNAALAVLASRRRRREESVDDTKQSGGPRSREATHEPHERDELSALVRQAVDALPEEYRVVLVLRDLEQLSSQEVAASLGLSDAAVRQRLHRARQVVGERLRPELCEGPNITCGGQLELLFDYLDRALDDSVRAPVLAHVAGCPTCQDLAEGYRRTIAAPADVEWKARDAEVARVVGLTRARLLRESGAASA
jgi:RNA polymerase sigma-70 factor (ECF subfamily)